MNSQVKDIKDMSPNPNLIELLEDYLKDAKSGELRSMVAAISWADDSVDHNWAIDKRSSERRLLAEVLMMQSDMVVNIGLKDGDSILARNLPEY